MFDLNAFNNTLKNIYCVNCNYNIYDLFCLVFDKINDELENTPIEDYEKIKKLKDDYEYLYRKFMTTQIDMLYRSQKLWISISSFIVLLERLKDRYNIEDAPELTEEESKKRDESNEIINEMCTFYFDTIHECAAEERKLQAKYDKCDYVTNKKLHEERLALKRVYGAKRYTGRFFEEQ